MCPLTSLRIYAVTVLPAMVLFTIASCLAALSVQVTDSSAKEAFIVVGLSLFLEGFVLGASWFYYWGLHQNAREEGNASHANCSVQQLLRRKKERVAVLTNAASRRSGCLCASHDVTHSPSCCGWLLRRARTMSLPRGLGRLVAWPARQRLSLPQ